MSSTKSTNLSFINIYKIVHNISLSLHIRTVAMLLHKNHCFHFVCILYSYSLLLDCWNSVPQSRPKFTEIVKVIDGLMEEKFGYMRMESSLSLQ